jgi:hypothetical protein
MVCFPPHPRPLPPGERGLKVFIPIYSVYAKIRWCKKNWLFPEKNLRKRR